MTAITYCECSHAAYLHYAHGRCSVEDPRPCPCVNLTVTPGQIRIVSGTGKVIQ